MSECDLSRERMPQLLLEALGQDEREATHLHIESCAECSGEWDRLRETWTLMGTLPELPVPSAVRQRFFATLDLPKRSNVVPFRARPAVRWIAQAAAVAVLVGGAFFAGRQASPADAAPEAPVYRIAGDQVIPASQLAPAIQGNPRFENVRFVSEGPDGDVQLTFDLTSRVTVQGRPQDESVANLLTHLVKNEQGAGHSRSAAIEWISSNPTTAGKGSADIARALAEVLATEANEGVRNKAIDALRAMSPEAISTSQATLISVLKNDPNPGIRLKAIETLSKIANAGAPLDPGMVDTLRQKSVQDDEPLIIRIRAAEALNQIHL
ncbi:MAG TPA: HEAT repeat domain-containing protein [Thermoanaerobaculia bacterium]